jgi:hypothetical protein
MNEFACGKATLPPQFTTEMDRLILHLVEWLAE